MIVRWLMTVYCARSSFTAFFVFVYCLFSASFASRRARRRAVLVRTASLLASYSRIASAASRARSSFAVIAASCWAFFNVCCHWDSRSHYVGLRVHQCGHFGILFSAQFSRCQVRNIATRRHDSIPLHEIAWQNPRLAKRYDRRRCQLDGAQILSGRLASPAVCDDVERDLLPLNEAAHAGAFDRTDMNEDVFATALQLNEAEAFLAVKPLYSSLVHGSSSFRYVCN